MGDTARTQAQDLQNKRSMIGTRGPMVHQSWDTQGILVIQRSAVLAVQVIRYQSVLLLTLSHLIHMQKFQKYTAAIKLIGRRRKSSDTISYSIYLYIYIICI